MASTGGTVSLLSGTNGTINIGTAGSVGAGGIVMNSGAGGIALTGNAAVGKAGATLDITSAGPVSQATSSAIIANILSSSGGITGTVNLAGTKNAIAALGNIVATNFSLNDSGNDHRRQWQCDA